MVAKTIIVFPHQTSWQYCDGERRRRMQVGCSGTNRDSGRIAGYQSMTVAVRDQQLTVVGAVVYNSYGARLFTAETATHQ